MSETLVEAWDIYDLDDDALRSQFECASRLAAEGVPAATALLAALEEELRERGQSTVILAGIEGQPLPEAAQPSSPSPSELATPPPAPDAPCEDPPPVAPRRRGLWDTDSDVSSEDEHPKKPPPLMRRRAGTGFVAFASTRKRPKDKLPVPAAQRKPTGKSKHVEKPSTAERVSRKPAVPRLSSTPLPRPGQSAKGGPSLTVPRKAPPRLASLVSTTLPVTAAATAAAPEHRTSGEVVVSGVPSDATVPSGAANGGADTSAGPSASELEPLGEAREYPEHEAVPFDEADGRDGHAGADAASTDSDDEDDDDDVDANGDDAFGTADASSADGANISVAAGLPIVRDQSPLNPPGPTVPAASSTSSSPSKRLGRGVRDSDFAWANTETPRGSPGASRGVSAREPRRMATVGTPEGQRMQPSPAPLSSTSDESAVSGAKSRRAFDNEGSGDEDDDARGSPAPAVAATTFTSDGVGQSSDSPLTQDLPQEAEHPFVEVPMPAAISPQEASGGKTNAGSLRSSGSTHPVPAALFAKRFPKPASLLVDPMTLRHVDQSGVGAAARSILQQIGEWSSERDAQAMEAMPGDDAFDAPPHARWAKVQCSRPEVHGVLVEAMSRTEDWCECATGCWDVWWLWRKPRPKDDAWFITQRVNHIPKTAALTHKDQLKSALQRYSGGRGSGAHLFELMPLTFNLPKDYVAFAQLFAERRGLWIMKTVGMSRGRGISIVSDISDVSYSAPVVVQEYVRNPLLVNGHKFDLRLYVCVTKFDPLEAFISSIGFARFATSTYTENAASLSDLSVHLTNTSVSEKISAGGTSKWSLEELAASGVIEDWAGVWGKVRGAVLRTLVAVEDRIPRCEAAFELFGFDVILDSNFRPWVLEVNASPSMELFGRLDEQLKPDMIRDVLDLVAGPSIDRSQLKELMANVTKTGAYVGKRAWGEAVSSVFNGQLPRTFGDPPPTGSSFESLAPSQDYDRAVRAKRSAV